MSPIKKGLLLAVSVLLCMAVAASAADLGRLSSNPYDPNSISNPYGAGNPYAPDSPYNPYGSGWRIMGE